MEKKSCNSSQDVEVRKGPWTMEEDLILINYIANHGEGVWNSLAKAAGLKRTGKSCRLRWLNYLRPDVRRGNITPEEQLLIMELHAKWGNRWSKIAKHLPGRTDNEIKNYWRTRIQKHLKQAENFAQESSPELNEHSHQASTSQMSGVGLPDHALDPYSPPSFPSNIEDNFHRMGHHHHHQQQQHHHLHQDVALLPAGPSSSVSVPNLPGESHENLWGMEDLWSLQLLNGD